MKGMFENIKKRKKIDRVQVDQGFGYERKKERKKEGKRRGGRKKERKKEKRTMLGYFLQINFPIKKLLYPRHF